MKLHRHCLILPTFLVMVVTGSAQHVTATLLRRHSLNTFSAASSIQAHRDLLYLVGDDENKILVLDTMYRKVDSIQFDQEGSRQAKLKKRDFEASFINTEEEGTELFVFASGSTLKRDNMLRIRLASNRAFTTVSFEQHYQAFLIEARTRLPEINIEGAVLAENHLIFANRGNYAGKKNKIIVIAREDFFNGVMNTMTVHDLHGIAEDTFKGVSEIFFDAAEKILFVTFSDEETHDSYRDGAIGNSTLAWISAADQKIRSHDFTLDGKLELAGVDPAFKGEKIEGLCARKRVDGRYLVDLVSDNDDGRSVLFRLLVGLP